METYAAGILFKSAGKVFLVKRGDDGSWAVPGGKLEEGKHPKPPQGVRCWRNAALTMQHR